MDHYLEVLSALDPASVILTPNRRLAMSLHGIYQKYQMEADKTCWTTPTILPVNVWIEELWASYARQSFATLPHVLNPAQEQHLWEEILTQSTYHDYFLQVSETSRLVKSARGLLKQWLITADHPLFASAGDYAALQQWINAFEQVCHSKHWIDAACLPDLVREQIIAGKILVPTKIYYAGFTDLSPQLTALFAAATERGTDLQAVTPTKAATSMLRTAASEADDELRLCAYWAKAQHDLQQQQTIGCVIPMLDKKRERVLQIFSEVFGSNEHFNISAGQPLAQYPVIHAALELLALYKKQISCESLFFLLSTPFIGGGEKERIKRSQFDGRIRAKNFSDIELAPQLVKNEDNKIINLARSCPTLARRISDFKTQLQESQTIASYAYWSPLFNRLLSTLGWPGERVLNSEEYQVVDEWLKLLHDLTTLDVTTAPVSFHQALQTLMEMAATKPFQPKSPSSNVQVLGVLEAAGLCFDQLWISGMDDTSWPSQPKPNPFIPKKLQRELKMPHASAERELEYCQTMTKQFQHSAQQIIFSYAKTQDENIVQPSPLIRAVEEVSPEHILPARPAVLSEKIFLHRNVEQLIDEIGPAHLADENASGGVDIIKNQASCPFKAFAICRLGARELESPLPGLRPKERGTIVHQIMEKCWDDLKSWDRLMAISDLDLHHLLEKIIDHALLDHAHAQQQQNSYLALEKQRLHKLVFDWLHIEKQRGPFVVLNSEKSAEIKLGALRFNVRIDRIDQLPDGNKLIIDYKTGTGMTIGHWFGDRPEEPQLPLYAQLDSMNTAGIVFAQVAAGNHCFKGVSQYPLEIKGIKAAEELRGAEEKNWQTLTNEWQTVLTKLGEDFYLGKACVDPKDKKATCQRCDLKPLCRINEYGGYEHDE
jgi:ATP-dependent helicase/nuclease subunit B